ncbi:uncharacterized protein LOC111345795 [Stylophora pistillata]|nr:uncharacterized protein LOC111345795 [Stylophora pistillata]
MAGAVNSYFTKNVTLLRFDDCQRSNGNILIPTTITLARIRKTAQYQPNVQFSINMSEQTVKQTLEAAFPDFDLNIGFSCAGINSQRNTFNLDGNSRIWDGLTIRRNLKGNSALYIVMDEPPPPPADAVEWLRNNLYYEATIKPAQSPMQGGDPFKVTFVPVLQETVTLGSAIFKKNNHSFASVELERSAKFGYLHGSSIPAAQEPGWADVEIESDRGILLGRTRIFYYPDERQVVVMVQQPSVFRNFCENMNRNSHGTYNSSTGRPQTSAAFGHEQQVQLLCLLVYTAAKEGAQHFVETIFTCSVGRMVFDAYKSNSQLPEVIARENGKLETARYLENITYRLLTESSASNECLKVVDWSELAKATNRAQQQLDLRNEIKRNLIIKTSDDTNNSRTVETSSKVSVSKSLESKEATRTEFKAQEDIQATLGPTEKKWDRIVDNPEDLNSLSIDLSELEMEQVGDVLAELQVRMIKIFSKLIETAESFHAAADKLDEVWKDCKAVRFVGTSSILGGLVMLGGGIASLMTAGAATAFIAAGIGFYVGGTIVKGGAHFYEEVKNSIEITKAEDLLQKLLVGIYEVDAIALSKLGTLEENNLWYLRYLAETQGLNDPIKNILAELAALRRKQAIYTKDFARTGTKTRSKSSFEACSSKLKSLDEVLLNSNVSTIIWDTEKLGLTIKDVIENKGSEAAKILRKKANELEKLAVLSEEITTAQKSASLGTFRRETNPCLNLMI